MAEAAPHELIIVRRHEDEDHVQHSSAWKVAHADFMTAMMAFFLIMWLINVTDDEMRKGIAQYFNPIHMSQGSSELKGLTKVKNQEKSGQKGHGDTPMPSANLNPISLSAGHADAELMSPEDAAAALNAAAELAAKLTAGTSADEEGKPEGAGQATAEALRKINEAAAALKPPNGGDDREAFQDPYAVLAKLEKEYVNTQATSVDAITGDARATGMPGGEIDRDPFDPSYWQMVPLPTARVSQTGKAGTASQAPGSGKPDAAAASGDDAAIAQREAVAAPGEAETPAKPAKAPAATKVEATKAAGPKQADAATVARSTEIAADIRNSIAPMMADRASPDLAVAATDEGVAISLTDDADYAMFGVGSAVPDAKTVVLIERIAKVLDKTPGAIVVRGHTDGRPFHSGDYDNWRLSTARAQMAYYTLLRGGLDQSRVIAIEGHADRALKDPANSYAAANRRIEILVKDLP